MNDNETYEFEDRRYVQPTLSSGEQEKFISNLRDMQNQNNSQITQQTQSLGTNIPSNLGGLGGGEAYFTSRYQTPQVNEMVDTLKSAAQAEALQEVMSNYKAQLQNRYKQKYREYERLKAKKSSESNKNNNNYNPSDGDGKKGEIDYVYTAYGSPWKDVGISDTSASYGLSQIKRNEGESDNDWYNRAREWGKKQAIYEKIRNGDFTSWKK